MAIETFLLSCTKIVGGNTFSKKNIVQMMKFNKKNQWCKRWQIVYSDFKLKTMHEKNLRAKCFRHCDKQPCYAHYHGPHSAELKSMAREKESWSTTTPRTVGWGCTPPPLTWDQQTTRRDCPTFVARWRNRRSSPIAVHGFNSKKRDHCWQCLLQLKILSWLAA